MKQYLIERFNDLFLKLPFLKDITIEFSTPKQIEHGDLSTNIALICSKDLGLKPRETAQKIIDSLELDADIIAKVEIAGPGFINFFYNQKSIIDVIKEAIEKNEDFGKNKIFNGKSAIVEFVSANPTGPLTVGHGRNAVIGDTISNMLEWGGCKVFREYYYNNAGRQMRILGESVKIRLKQVLGANLEFPDDHYQGEYIKEIAKLLLESEQVTTAEDIPDEKYKDFAQNEIFIDIVNTLKRLGIRFDNFYNEYDLYKNKRIDDVLRKFEEMNISYQKDGAIWLRLSEMGNENDKVIVKSTGEPTYRLPDIAYHITKFERGFNFIIDLFGADHKDTYPDVLAALKELGYDTQKVKVLLHQFVTVVRDGEIVKMSTRKANFITLDYLIDETSSDVVRYFFIMRGISTHLNFDINLAKKQSDENPVFYLHYAHARICSILRTVEDEGLSISIDNLELLKTESEQNLIKKLMKFKEETEYAIRNFEPNKISNYLEELAALFHKFYAECRILGQEKKLAEARLALALATKITLKNGLHILGISAPERM